MRISFEDSLKGLQTTVPVTLELACHTCHGTGAAPGTAPKRCPQCDGTGVVATSQGLFALQQPCPNCRGNGTIVDTPCETCHGSGRERRTKRYTVRIPAGVKDGTKIRLKGKGEAGWGGAPAGDLFVVTRVEPSKLYERRGDDLVLDVPVTFGEAAMGATVEIPTPEGRVSLKVPAGSQDGKLLRVKGRGSPRLNGSRPGRPARAAAGEHPVEAVEGRARGARELREGVAREPAREAVRMSTEHDRLLARGAARRAGAADGRRRRPVAPSACRTSDAGGDDAAAPRRRVRPRAVSGIAAGRGRVRRGSGGDCCRCSWRRSWQPAAFSSGRTGAVVFALVAVVVITLVLVRKARQL